MPMVALLKTKFKITNKMTTKNETTKNDFNATFGNTVLPAGWSTLDEMPPDERVEVIDINGNKAFANPTYYPFEIVKKQGDEKKQWGWRGTPVFYEDGKSRWDGGWLIECVGLTSNVGTIIGWRSVQPACR